MHTVKSKESISSAYFDYGVKSFSLDNKDELRKILEATKQAKDLKELLQKMSIPLDSAILMDIDFEILMKRLVGRRTCSKTGKLLNI